MSKMDRVYPRIGLCPCCSGDKVRVVEHIVYRIICAKCGSHTRKGKMDEIITLWNEGRGFEDE